MNRFLNTLPGSRQSLPGLERRVLRQLPKVLWMGSVLLVVPSVLARLVDVGASAARVDMYVAGVLMLHWTALLTVGIAAATVWVMKGPAYVADAYPLADAERPDTTAGGRP